MNNREEERQLLHQRDWEGKRACETESESLAHNTTNKLKGIERRGETSGGESSVTFLRHLKTCFGVCECDACARLKLVAHLSLDARSLALIVRYCNVHDPVFKDRSQRVRTSDF